MIHFLIHLNNEILLYFSSKNPTRVVARNDGVSKFILHKKYDGNRNGNIYSCFFKNKLLLSGYDYWEKVEKSLFFELNAKLHNSLKTDHI